MSPVAEPTVEPVSALTVDPPTRAWTPEIEARLRRVQAHILAHPGQFDMSDFVYHEAECGTVACIGGWAAIDAGYLAYSDWHGAYLTTATGRAVMKHYQTDVYHAALPLPPRTLDHLFYTDEWPFAFYRAYAQAVEANEYDKAARIASNYIDYFIACRGEISKDGDDETDGGDARPE